MTVCLDTNVLLQMFAPAHPTNPLRQALMTGRLQLALSNEILLEYEEVVTRLSGTRRWRQVESFLEALFQTHANVLFLEPQFRFQVISVDPDDNKFVDCAIAAQADYIVTEDQHFAELNHSGYKPRSVSPSEFITRHLSQRK